MINRSQHRSIMTTDGKKKGINNKIKSFLDYMYEMDYKERPADIDTFLCSDEFLGGLTDHGKTIYPIWRESLREIVNEDSKYLVILTGALRVGKTRAAIYAVAYLMHKLLCMKDPWKFFHKSAGGKLSIVFYNLTKSLGNSQGFMLLMGHLTKSPWFIKHGIMCGTEHEPRIEFPIFEYILSSPQARGFGFIGKDVVLAIMDEVDDPTASEEQKAKVLSLYNAGMRRFEDTFVWDGQTIGRFFLLASKQEKHSFLNTFVAEMRGSKQVYIKDLAIWDAKPAGEYCGDRFPVSLGDPFMPPRVLDGQNGQDEIDKEQRAGRQVIMVPVEYKEKFEMDVVGSLRDFAGISISHLRAAKLFASESVLIKCYDPEKRNPVAMETIEIGLKDDADLLNYIDFTAIRIPRNVPRYIHVDIAYSGDALGLGMSCVKGWTKINTMKENGTFAVSKMPVVETDLAMRIKARMGDQIPIFKVRQMILDLNSKCGFNIALVTLDLRLLSTDCRQLLEQAGLRTDYFSVDKDPQIYRSFKDIVNEGRWMCFKDSYLHFELANLEDDRKHNRIDHPTKVIEMIPTEGKIEEIVRPGSKDKADGVAGSVMKAIEDCKTPPDIEVMTKLYQAVVDVPKIEQNIEPLLGINPKPKKEAEKQPTKAENSVYKDILRKALG